MIPLQPLRPADSSKFGTDEVPTGRSEKPARRGLAWTTGALGPGTCCRVRRPSLVHQGTYWRGLRARALKGIVVGADRPFPARHEGVDRSCRTLIDSAAEGLKRYDLGGPSHTP